MSSSDPAQEALRAGRATRRVGPAAGPALRLALGLAALAAAAGAQPAALTVAEDLPLTSLERHLEFLVDPERELAAATVVGGRHDTAFTPLEPGRRLELGYTEAALWIRFRLANPAPNPVEVLLDIGYPSLDRIELYVPRADGGFEEVVAGDSLPLAARTLRLRKFVFPVTVPAASTERYYTRITTSSSLAVPVRASGVLPYLERIHHRQLWLGVFYGVLLGALLYYVLVLAFVPRAVYLQYTAHVLCLILGFACLDGLAPWLWPRATTWNHFVIHFLVYLFSAILIFFVRHFIDTPKVYPRLDRWLRATAWTIVASLPLTPLIPHFILVRLAMGTVIAVGMVLAATVFRRAWSGHRPAQIYSLAWVALTVSLAYGAAANLNLAPGYIAAVEIARAAIGLEVVLSGLALVQALAETQRALSASEQKLAKAFRASPDAILIAELDGGRILEVNDGFRDLSGYGRRAAVGGDPAALGLWSAGDSSRLLGDLALHGLVRDVEMPMRTAAGDARFCRVSAECVRLGHGDCFVALVRDVTEERAAAAEREELISALQAKNRELENFSYSVSHDLRSPLVTIKGFLGWVARDAESGDAERLRSDLQQIDSAVDQMSTRLDEILLLSRSGRVIQSPSPVALEQAAREAAELLAGALGARHVEVEIGPGLPQVAGDHGRMVQVMQNLLENAIKFMGPQPRPRIEIGVRRDPDGEVVVVRDNGIGIEARFLDRIFGLFDRLESDAPSTGIGLAIVRRIVEAHGGRVWAESEGPGSGSTFCLAFSSNLGAATSGDRAGRTPVPVLASRTAPAHGGRPAGTPGPGPRGENRETG